MLYYLFRFINQEGPLLLGRYKAKVLVLNELTDLVDVGLELVLGDGGLYHALLIAIKLPKFSLGDLNLPRV